MREHPCEFNIIMVEQRAIRDAFRHNLNEFFDSPIESALVTAQHIPAQRRWLLDSGASSHYIKEAERFHSYCWLDTSIKILTGSGPVWGVA